MRRLRTQQIGRTNYDSRATLVSKDTSLSRTPLHISPYPHYQFQLGMPRTQSACKLPIQEKLQNSQKKHSSAKHYQATTLSKPRLKHHSIDLSTDTKPSKVHSTDKIEANKRSTQATQLIHTDYKATPEGEANLQKIADIRRLIRQRYANRGNLRKVFNHWDRLSEGYIRPEDVTSMLSNLSIPVNATEVEVFVKSITQSEKITIQDFINFIYEESDTFNSNIDFINFQTQEGKDKFEQLTQEHHKHTQQDTLRKFLNTYSYGLASQFMRIDTHKTGIVSYDEFCNVLKNMHLPPTLSTKSSWNTLYKDLGGINDVIDYKNAMFLLQGRKKAARDLVCEKPRRAHIRNKQEMPLNQLESILKKGKPIRFYLQKLYQTEAEFYEALKECGGSNISHTQLEEFLKHSLQEFPIGHDKLEAFLSGFTYNPEGLTRAKEVSQLVFSDETQVSYLLAERKRPLPPSREANNKQGSLRKVQPLLLKMKEKIGEERAYTAFKKFDHDNDGYISKADLETSLNNLIIPFSSKQLDHLITYLDISGSGYVDFHSFVAVLQHDNSDYSAQPSRDYTHKQAELVKSSQSWIDKGKKKLTLDEKQLNLTRNTRYSSTPSHQNTFVNFMPDSYTGLYISEKERMSMKNINPINIGFEDKQCRFKRTEKRLNYLKSTKSLIENKIAEKDSLKSKKIQRNLLIKRQAEMLYEANVRYHL